MANNRIYPVTHHSMMELADHMYNYLTDVQWMDAQRTYIEESGFVVVQARAKAGKFKQILGKH